MPEVIPLNNLEKLARHVTAGDLQLPFGPRLTLATTADEARDALMSFPVAPAPFHRLTENEVDRICLVYNERDDPTHYVWGEDLPVEGAVSTRAIPISPSLCVTDSTPALTLMRQFGTMSRRWCLVMTQTELTGYVSWVEMYRPELRVCILALLLDVEQRCGEAITWEPGDAESAWSRLSPGRQAKAIEVFVRRYNRSPTDASKEELLFCTTFIDKAALISPLPQFANLSRRQLHAAFALMENLRNSLAHTSMDARGEFTDLLSAVQVAEAILLGLAPQSEAAPLRLVVSNPTTFPVGQNAVAPGEDPLSVDPLLELGGDAIPLDE